jgi:hypothetical protein
MAKQNSCVRSRTRCIYLHASATCETSLLYPARWCTALPEAAKTRVRRALCGACLSPQASRHPGIPALSESMGKSCHVSLIFQTRPGFCLPEVVAPYAKPSKLPCDTMLTSRRAAGSAACWRNHAFFVNRTWCSLSIQSRLRTSCEP